MKIAMNHDSIKCFPVGGNALTIEFSNVLSFEVNDKIQDLSRFFLANKFPGLIETVPAYSSLTFFYDVLKIKSYFPLYANTFEAVKNIIENNINSFTEKTFIRKKIIQIPVKFDDQSSLDLTFIAQTNNLTVRNVVEIFTQPVYKVFMLGFLPGFAYMGEVDARIATPRKSAPRNRVPKGSVGIAGAQTGIYPFESPGGWQIIGRTDIELFTPQASHPTFFQPGDLVKFYPI